MNINIPKHDITIYQGMDYSIDLIYAEDDETPIDVSEWNLDSHLRQTPESADYFEFIPVADEDGFHLSMPKEITNEITFSSGVYDVFITDPEYNIRTPLIYGSVTIIPRSTR